MKSLSLTLVGLMATALLSVSVSASTVVSTTYMGGYTQSVAVDESYRAYMAVAFTDTQVYELRTPEDGIAHIAAIREVGQNRAVYVDSNSESYICAGLAGLKMLNESSYNIESSVDFPGQDIVDVVVDNVNNMIYTANWNDGFAAVDFQGNVLWQQDTWTAYGISMINADTLVVLDSNPSVQLWDVSTNSPVFLSGYGNTASDTAVYQDDLYVSMKEDGVVRLDVNNPNDIIALFANDNIGDARGIAIEAGYVYVAAGDIKILDAETLELVETVVTPGDANDCDVFGGGNYLAVADGEEGLTIINLNPIVEEPVEDLPSYEDGYNDGYQQGWIDALASVEECPAIPEPEICLQDFTQIDIDASFEAGVVSVEECPAIPEPEICLQDFTQIDIDASFEAGVDSVEIQEVTWDSAYTSLCGEIPSDLNNSDTRKYQNWCRQIERFVNKINEL